MSTRANIELYTGWEKGSEKGKRTIWEKGAILYHHCDGYPSWMGPELESKLKAAKKELEKAGRPYWWDSERVGALIVKLSANAGKLHWNIPTFQPCLNLHGDIDYLWKVFMGPKYGESKIQCFRVAWDWEKDRIKSLKKVDWKKEAGL